MGRDSSSNSPTHSDYEEQDYDADAVERDRVNTRVSCPLKQFVSCCKLSVGAWMAFHMLQRVNWRLIPNEGKPSLCSSKALPRRRSSDRLALAQNQYRTSMLKKLVTCCPCHGSLPRMLRVFQSAHALRRGCGASRVTQISDTTFRKL